MTRKTRLAAALAASFLYAGTASAVDWENWPTKYSFSNGTEIAASANFAYDVVDFGGDNGYDTPATRLKDDGHYRRREFGAILRKKDVFDLAVNYDFESKLWLDVALRLETKAWFGKDYGRIRVGYFKTPVSLESNGASRATQLMEYSAASQAIFEGRRTGVEWSLDRPKYGVALSYFFGNDLQGDNPGTTAGGRVFWTPIREKDKVVHLGLTGSVENPHGWTDGRGVHFDPSVRFRSRPQNGLTPTRLVDSGNLGFLDKTVRSGFEAVWIDGQFSLQGEYLRATAEREDGRRDFTADGFYITGSWVATGETRPYSNGNIGNIKPSHSYGAVEFITRYGELDLNDRGVAGGRQRDLTLGVNWFLTSHFKFQANYVKVSADRGLFSADPDVVEFRAQLMF